MNITSLQKFENTVYNFNEEAGQHLNDLEELNHTLQNPKLAELIEQFQKNVYPQFEPDQTVELTVIGSGKVFPEGAHLVRGKIIKSGVSPNCWRVALDEPLGQDTVIEAHVFTIRKI